MFKWLNPPVKTSQQKYDEAVIELAAYTKIINDFKLTSFSENLLSKLVALEVRISMAKKELQTNTSATSSVNIVNFNKDKK